MGKSVTTEIDAELCTGCGDCVTVCPSGTLEMRDDKAVVCGDSSLNCGHCAAACPVDAIRVGAIDPGSWQFASFSMPSSWLPHGQPEIGELVRLMASRRSCRNYTAAAVDRALLTDLVKIATTAPSGTNSQRWAFTVLPTRTAVLALGQQVRGFFARVARLARHGWLAWLLRLLGKPQLLWFRREFLADVEQALEEYERDGVDQLFHGATAAILVSSRRGASCPAEDALLASQNILLAAHAMGLGTCLIGYVVEAMRADRSIARALGLEPGERVHAVIGLGHPAESYQGLPGRYPLKPRWFEG